MRSIINNIFILMVILMYASANTQVRGNSQMLETLVEVENRLKQLEERQSPTPTGQNSSGCSQLASFDEFIGKILRMDMRIEQLERKCGETCRRECPDGWVAFGDSCYLFWNNTSISFAKATEICEQKGARVVFVETQEENNFLKSYLRKLPAAFWWIGMTDQETEGVWRWYGTNNVVLFTDWNKGEPNGGKTDNCAHFFSWYDYTWNDISCTAEKSYTLYAICERKSC